MSLTITKETPADHPINDLIRTRWSPRAFAPTPIEEEKLQQIFEAARWAPSSSNVQPWRFLVTRSGEARFAALRSCLSQGNQPWTENVPVLLIGVADTVFPAKYGKPARPSPTAKHDLGLATANLLLEATELGLYVHPMAGFDAAQVTETFAIPDPYEPVTVLAVGYIADPNTLTAEERERENAPRSRKQLSDFVFENAWGKPAGFTRK